MVTVLANWQTQGFALNAVWLAATITLAGGGYFLVSRFLGLREVDYFLQVLQRKAGRS